MKRYVFWGLLLGILMVGLATGSDLWAAPGQCPERQTVPTRTPTPPPPTPTLPPPPPDKSPVPTPTALATSPAPSGEALPGESSKPLLPEAGGRSIGLHLGVALMAVGLLVLAVVRRRVWR